MRILIVEDEKIIRSAIAEEVQSTGLFSQVHSAANGEEALEMALGQDYDGILLDIMMPKMDGLTFLAALRAQNPARYDQAVKVVLSGYDDFAFAQKALQQGVDDFLLKPMRPAEVRALAKRIYDMASLRRSAEESRHALQQRNHRREVSLRQLFWKSLLLGEETGNNLEERCRELDIPLDMHCRVCLFHTLEYDENGSNSGWENPVEHILSDICTAESSTLLPMDTHTTALILFREEGVNENVLEELRATAEALGPSWIFIVGPAVTAVIDLHKSYSEANFLLTYAIANGRNFLSPEDLDNLPSNTQSSLPLNDLFQLQTWLRLGDEDSILDYLDCRFAQIRQDPDLRRPDSLQAFVSGLRFLCTSALQEKAGGQTDGNYLRIWKEIAESKSSFLHFSAFEAELRRMVNSTLEYCKKDAGTGGALVNQAKSMVVGNCAQDLSSSEIAEKLGVSRNYFGQLFKRSEGLSFSEFVSKVRMNKAAELLAATNLKVYEISDAVGISDAYYFSQLFKKFYGMSPRQFREGKR